MWIKFEQMSLTGKGQYHEEAQRLKKGIFKSPFFSKMQLRPINAHLLKRQPI